MRKLVLLFALLFLTGCSVGMAMSGTENQDTSILFPGAPRQVVIVKMGPPETSTTSAVGERVDSYLITKGNEPSVGRAAVHAGLDVLTFGLWEVIGTPVEMGAGTEHKSRYIIIYDKDDKVKDIQKIEGATKVEGQ